MEKLDFTPDMRLCISNYMFSQVLQVLSRTESYYAVQVTKVILS